MTVLAFGGVHAPIRALVLVLTAALLGLLATLPADELAEAWSLRGWVAAAVGVSLALCVGFLPVPEAVRDVVAVGDVRSGWAAASASPERTLDALAHAWWLAGLGAATSVVAGASRRRSALLLAIPAATGLLVAVGAAHWFGGVDQLYGVFPRSDHRPFAAPFIDANHFAGLLLLGLPSVLDGALDPSRQRSARAAYAAVALAALGMEAVVASTGPLALAGLQVAVVIGRRIGFLRLLPVLAFAVPLAAWRVGAGAGAGDVVDLHGRASIWAGALRMGSEHWLFGTGAGTFSSAIQPYRTDHTFAVWDHAHNDWLELVVETGALGLVGWLVVAVALRPRRTTPGSGAWLLDLGVAGVLLHAFVEFPLVIPGIAGPTVAVWALRRTLFTARPGPGWRPTTARVVLVGLAGMQLAAAGWMARAAVVQEARARVAAHEVTPRVVRRLEWLAPGVPGTVLAKAELLLDDEPTEAADLARGVVASAAHDGDALRTAAVILAKAGQRGEALEVARAAVERAPRDWRGRVLVATLQTDPDAAIEAWKAALGEMAPPRFFASAWKVAPIGVVWVDAVVGLPGSYQGALASFLVARGDTDAAALAFEQGQLTDGGGYPAYADLLLTQGRVAEADAYVSRALDEDPTDREFLRRRARVWEAQERWAEAEAVWEGLAHHRTGRDDAVRGAVRSAKHVSPEAALALVERLRLARVGGEVLVLEDAKLREEQGDYRGCVTTLVRSNLLDEPKVSPALTRLLDRCRAGLAGQR